MRSSETKSKGTHKEGPARGRYSLVLIIGTLLVVGGCSPQERLAKLLRKYPELRDTVVVVDTVETILPTVEHDTVFASRPGDTVVLREDRLVVKYVRLAGDSVYIQGQCLADTVRVPYRVEVPTVQPSETVYKVPFWAKAALAALLLILLVGSIFRTR